MIEFEPVVHELSRLGVVFTIEHEGPTGVMRVALPPLEVPSFARDPNGWLARHYAVTRHEFLDWQRDRYSAYCCGLTSAGRACRNPVPGGINVATPRAWADLQGGKCKAHQEREQ